MSTCEGGFVMSQTSDRGVFSSKLGYVLATVGSAVGLGNIWRFPYLAAKHGGGSFLLVYIILALTFGFAMIVSETAMGRASKNSPIGAFRYFCKPKAMRAGGWISSIIPLLILPYYSVIGGWVLKYLFSFIAAGDLNNVATDSFFSTFVGQGFQVEFWFFIFTAAVILVIAMGVEGGVEKVSKIMMPILVVLAVIICVYVMLQPGAMEGVKYFFVPNFKDFSIMTVVAAMGQMFFSLSIATGVLITYGSYMTDDMGIESSTIKIEIFDTGVAVLAGLMIIPAVFAFSDPETLKAGPSLMFVTMPKIFVSMKAGRFIGIMFFVLVFFAALTSAISLCECVVSTLCDQFRMKRVPAALVAGLLTMGLGTLSALGYGVLGNVRVIGMQFLDFFDFITNSIMMPLSAFFICICIVRFMGLERLRQEVTLKGEHFRRYGIYKVMIAHICPLFVLVILISSIASTFGFLSY